ncbi:hypothetical protein Thiosp_03189 [Thiorhodovibrio litoralis]|nr:hypothetical protein [Thiorhodovibrio winogradskyi]WPL13388.1 hypothetical protein Thiosp_03189 [Thiorhodovibrio litoralis]
MRPPRALLVFFRVFWTMTGVFAPKPLGGGSVSGLRSRWKQRLPIGETRITSKQHATLDCEPLAKPDRPGKVNNSFGIGMDLASALL